MSDRLSRNALYLGDRVWVSSKLFRSGGMPGVISSFAGKRVFVLLDGFSQPHPFRFDQVS